MAKSRRGLRFSITEAGKAESIAIAQKRGIPVHQHAETGARILNTLNDYRLPVGTSVKYYGENIITGINSEDLRIPRLYDKSVKNEIMYQSLEIKDFNKVSKYAQASNITISERFRHSIQLSNFIFANVPPYNVISDINSISFVHDRVEVNIDPLGKIAINYSK